MFFEAVDLRLSTHDPVVVYHSALGTVSQRRKYAVSFLEVVDTTQVPAGNTVELYRQVTWHYLLDDVTNQ